MRKERRDYIDIFYDILFSIRNNRKLKVTHLMHKANLNHSTVLTYCRDMEERGLIESTTERGSKYYKITKKGIEGLNDIKDFYKSIHPERIKLPL